MEQPIRPVQLQPSCLNLRHKLMYIDERQTQPGVVDDSSDTRVFFCVKTQDTLGPDGEPAAPTQCGSERSCYCAGASAPAGP